MIAKCNFFSRNILFTFIHYLVQFHKQIHWHFIETLINLTLFHKFCQIHDKFLLILTFLVQIDFSAFFPFELLFTKSENSIEKMLVIGSVIDTHFILIIDFVVNFLSVRQQCSAKGKNKRSKIFFAEIYLKNY